MSDEHEAYVTNHRSTMTGMSWWTARCDCGYQSRLLGSPFQAERAAAQHAKAKNGAAR